MPQGVTVFALQSRNYQVSAALGVSPTMVTPMRCIFDTGAGPNIVHLRVLPDNWESYRVADAPPVNLMGAGGRRLHQRGTVSLHVEIGRLRVRAQFLVVQNLAADCILGCQFINRQVQAILPKEKQIRLIDGSSIPILRDIDPLVPRQEPSGPPVVVSTKVRVARFVTIPAHAEVPVQVQCAAPGVRFLQAYHRPHDHTGVSLANGVADIIPLEPFTVRVLNTSGHARVLPKGMVLGHALPHPKQIISLVDVEARPPDLPDVDGAQWQEEVNLDHLVPSLRQKVLGMLATHRQLWDGRLGRVSATSHHIDLVPGARPVHCQPYRAGPRAREAESAEVRRMLEAGVIEPASSEWASPVVLVPKPDGSLRFCVDYRRLNALTIRDSYPLPRMDECIDSLGDACVFTTLDCNSGYWQIPVAPDDMDKTTFTSHEGTYRFRRMPFGLRNAPATFQRTVDIVLSGLTWKSCLVYLDDIIIYSKTMNAHVGHLDEVLTLLGTAGLSLKLAKCFFFKDTVDYLGHVIRPGKLAVAVKNTDSLRSALPPTTQTELRSFLGLCNVYRRFVPGFAKIAEPLNHLLKKGEGPKLGPLTKEQLLAFEALREKLLQPPILALPRREGRYVLDTDASDGQIGCCLSQEHPDGLRHPNGYWSRSLNPAERNYSTTEKECLAIVWAILTLRPYLEGQRFLIRTDHHSLRWVLNLADAQGRLARWRLRLLEFDFEVEYSPGKEHHAADVMSRLSPSPLAEETMGPMPVPLRPVTDTGATCPDDLYGVPCFPLLHASDPPDPNLVSVDDVRAFQLEHWADPLGEDLMLDTAIDLEDNGVAGTVLPNGEFSVLLPEPVHPVAITAAMDAPEDTRDLGRGDCPGFSPLDMKYECKAMA